MEGPRIRRKGYFRNWQLLPSHVLDRIAVYLGVIEIWNFDTLNEWTCKLPFGVMIAFHVECALLNAQHYHKRKEGARLRPAEVAKQLRALLQKNHCIRHFELKCNNLVNRSHEDWDAVTELNMTIEHVLMGLDKPLFKYLHRTFISRNSEELNKCYKQLLPCTSIALHITGVEEDTLEDYVAGSIRTLAAAEKLVKLQIYGPILRTFETRPMNHFFNLPSRCVSDLSALKNLCFLDLKTATIDLAGTEHLVQLIRGSKIIYLCVAFACLESFISAAKYLELDCSLQYARCILNLSNWDNVNAEECLCAFAQALRRNTTLKGAQFECTRNIVAGKPTVMQLVSMLKANNSLKYLGLTDIKLNAGLAARIAYALRNKKTLRCLSMRLVYRPPRLPNTRFSFDLDDETNDMINEARRKYRWDSDVWVGSTYRSHFPDQRFKFDWPFYLKNTMFWPYFEVEVVGKKKFIN